MSEKRKLVVFTIVFIIASILPVYVRVGKIPIYILWMNNAIFTIYLLVTRKKEYRRYGLILGFIILLIHNYYLLGNYYYINKGIAMIGMDTINLMNGWVIFKILKQSNRYESLDLSEIIKITFLKVLPSIALFGIMQEIILKILLRSTLDYRFYNFILADFLGYIFIFTIGYIIRTKVNDIKISSTFFLFFIIIFLFDTEKVGFVNIVDMSKSHLEYISIFILVLSCILLSAEEFIVLIVEDFIVSYSMIQIFIKGIDKGMQEYVVVDLQLFYAVVMTTCFFLIVLKIQNKKLVKEISEKNKMLKIEADENKGMLKKVDILIDSMENVAFIAEENGNIIYSNKAFDKIIKENNINEVKYFKKILNELKTEKKVKKRKEVRVKERVIMQEIFISKFEEKYFISGIGTDITKIKLVQKKLEKSKEEAEEANKAKTSLLARVSHELKTPMNTITGINYLLAETNLDKTQRKFVGKIGKASDILLKMIEDILDVSKVTNSGVKLEKNIISLKEIIDTVVLVKEDEIERKGLEFKREIARDLPEYIIGDEFRLQQILINLIGNAIKFTEQGYIKLGVEAIKKENLIWTVKFIVEDTGIGISEDKKLSIFEPFTQEDESITRRYGGTGIGLTICRNIVDELKGEVIVESKKGHGSKFNVIINVTEYINEGKKEKANIVSKNREKNISNKIINANMEISKLNRLIGLLKTDIGEAFDILESLEESLGKTIFEKNLLDIKELIDTFEIDKAIKEIEELKLEILKIG